jgi:hypothetical protein
MTAKPDSIIAGCWIIFLVYWFISAFAVKKTSERKSWLSSLPYRIPVVFGAILMWHPRLPRPLNLALTPRTNLTLDAAAAVCVCGLLVTLWAPDAGRQLEQ